MEKPRNETDLRYKTHLTLCMYKRKMLTCPKKKLGPGITNVGVNRRGRARALRGAITVKRFYGLIDALMQTNDEFSGVKYRPASFIIQTKWVHSKPSFYRREVLKASTSFFFFFIFVALPNNRVWPPPVTLTNHLQRSAASQWPAKQTKWSFARPLLTSTLGKTQFVRGKKSLIFPKISLRRNCP